MGDITVTAAKFGLSTPPQSHSEIYPVIVSVAVTAGQSLYQKSDGEYALADARTLATAGVRGLAMNAANAGGHVDLLKRGTVTGFATASIDDKMYQSDTPGALSTVPGTIPVRVGRVTSRSDSDQTELAYFEADWTDGWEEWI